MSWMVPAVSATAAAALVLALVYYCRYRRCRSHFETVTRRLRASEARYRALFDHANDAIFLHDLAGGNPPGRFIEVNDVACERLGYTREELLGRSPNDIDDPQSPVDPRDIAAQMCRNGRAVFRATQLTRDGRKLPVEISSHVFTLDGRPTALSIARDLSDRLRIEEELRQSQKMESIGRLAGGIAHDFNNLLTAIIGHASFAFDSLPADAPTRDEIGEVLASAQRAANLTRQLLAFSRRQVIEPRVTDLNELVANMDRMLRRLIGEDIDLVTVTAPAPVLAVVDPGQIEQALLNLAVNARDAMSTGGTLTIEIAAVELDEADCRTQVGAVPGRYVMLAVSDTGAGMDDEVKRHLFEPFFTTKEVGSGTGLGLATAYGILRQHQGHIVASSEVGAGSTFRLYLPHAPEGATLPPPRRQGTPPPRGDETVLLVEDEPAVRRAAVRILEHLGYRVLVAADGEEAVALAHEQASAIDLVLTDVVMPRLGGRELVARLKPLLGEFKVLFISGYAATGIARHGILEPGANLLQKPFTVTGLAERLREVLDG